jgi:hypothetical protein
VLPVRFSGLDKIAPGIYVDAEMPESQRRILLSSSADAKERVATLYGEYRAGMAYLTLAASFVVLGPDGISSVDVLSHELAHVEFSARIGHRNRARIPNWFDEGLATQFDDRYSEAEWQIRTDSGKTAPSLDQIGIIKHDDRPGYATAKHEVQRWLAVVGPEGFRALLQSIRSGAEFQETYHSIERAKE